MEFDIQNGLMNFSMHRLMSMQAKKNAERQRLERSVPWFEAGASFKFDRQEQKWASQNSKPWLMIRPSAIW
jgi:hypothetical protein